jgi:hypothetical protein
MPYIQSDATTVGTINNVARDINTTDNFVHGHQTNTHNYNPRTTTIGNITGMSSRCIDPLFLTNLLLQLGPGALVAEVVETEEMVVMQISGFKELVGNFWGRVLLLSDAYSLVSGRLWLRTAQLIIDFGLCRACSFILDALSTSRN